MNIRAIDFVAVPVSDLTAAARFYREVLGLRLNGGTKAYPFSVLERTVDSAGRMTDTLDGQALLIRYNRANRTAEAFDAQGKPLTGTLSFWFAWVAFYPRTDVLRAP